MVTSLLKQLVYQYMKIPSSLELAYDNWDKGQRKTRPDEYAFTKLFTECAKEFSTLYESAVFVLLDAYDESLEMERNKLVSHLQQFYQSGIRLYITTRTQYRDDLQQAFVGAITLDIRAHGIDIENYLRDQLSRRKKNLANELKEMIVKKLNDGRQEWYVLR